MTEGCFEILANMACIMLDLLDELDDDGDGTFSVKREVALKKLRAQMREYLEETYE